MLIRRCKRGVSYLTNKPSGNDRNGTGFAVTGDPPPRNTCGEGHGPGWRTNLAAGAGHTVVGLKLGRIRPVSHGTDRYGYIRLALIFVRLHVLIVFSKSSKTRSHEADSKSQSVSGFGITKFALGNSLLIDGKRLGSANESPLSRLSWAMGKRG
jgi:hypothetical protein